MLNKVILEDIIYITGSSLPWHALAGKTVLVTGAGGMLPSYIVDTLLYLNDLGIEDRINVIGLARNRDRALERLGQYKNSDDFSLIIQDICTPVHLDLKIDYIIHAACQASPKYYNQDPAGVIWTNVKGMQNLLELAVKNKVDAFLYFSSSEVYGEVNESLDSIREIDKGYIDPMDTRNCYAESKRICETMCISWYQQFGVPVKIVRPFHTYGPGLSLDDGRVFADFVADILHGRNISLKGNGSTVRSFCYLADAALGYFTVLLKGETAQAYNVGNDQCAVSILELARLLSSLVPEKQLKVIVNHDQSSGNFSKDRVMKSCPDISKIRALGWEPVYTIKEGFERTIRSFL
jgi:UDP-glucuronate decarboxylase